MPAEVETMMYVQDRGLPWWVGIEDGEANPLADLATAEEAIVESGLDWDVKLEQIALARPGPLVISPDRFATVRSTDEAWLGTVGRAYNVIQNREAFAFADSIVDDGSAKYETAGSLRGGRIVFLSMELNKLDLRLDGEHPDGTVKTYLLLSNGHDGSRALQVDITKVRTVCKNTLNLAIKGATHSFKVRHSGSIEGKLIAARQALGITFTYDVAFNKMAQALMLKKVTDAQVLEIFQNAVWPIDVEQASEARIESHAATLAFDVYQESQDLDPIRGTAWGALNAVAEYVDHHEEYRARYDSIQDVRANSILWGTAQHRKQLAFDALVKVGK